MSGEIEKACAVSQKERGMYRKFIVKRCDGRDQTDRAGAVYFVLDMTYDPYAKAAVEAYVTACFDTHPKLAIDLIRQYGLTNMRLPR